MKKNLIDITKVIEKFQIFNTRILELNSIFE